MDKKDKLAELRAKKKTMSVPGNSFSKSSSNQSVKHNNKNVKQFNKSAGRSGDK